MSSKRTRVAQIVLALSVAGCAHAGVEATSGAGGSTPPPPPPSACATEWIHLPVLVRFEVLSSDVGADHAQLLDELVEALHSRQYLDTPGASGPQSSARQTREDGGFQVVRVEGHTTGCASERGNPQRLSEQRAQSVADELISRGIGAERIQTIGYGHTLPRTDQCAEAGSRLGARVELSIRVCRSSS